VVEVADETKRLKAIANAYCESPENTLVISPANRERVKINSLIHRKLQNEGKVCRADHQMSVLVNRQDITGAERTFANSYVPDEDIIRYNRASKVYGVQVGDYSRVKNTNHADNTITVQMEDGRELTYNPSRLSGVSVYKESTREFAEGDRIQFRAPFIEKRIANGELGSIDKIEHGEMRVALDSGREVAFEPDKYRHIDHGYAVTSHSSQGQTVDRVLVNADARESELLLNDRMGYVAVSRAREDAVVYTNSIEELRGALDRRVDKEMAVEAVYQAAQHKHDLKDQQNPYEGENRESLEVDQGYEQDMNDESHNRAAEAIDIEEMELAIG